MGIFPAGETPLETMVGQLEDAIDAETLEGINDIVDIDATSIRGPIKAIGDAFPGLVAFGSSNRAFVTSRRVPK